MSLINREDTINNLQTFLDRHIGSCGCKFTEADKKFCDGIKFAIRYIKLQDEVEPAKQIGFDFSEDCQWK